MSIQRGDREGREDREELEVEKGDLEVQLENPPVAKRTWLQTAAAAGVLAMVREGEALGEEEFPSKKKKTPKQLRSQELVERNTMKVNKKSRSKAASPKSKVASPEKKLRKVTTPGCGSSLLDKGFLENNSLAEEEEEERRKRKEKEIQEILSYLAATKSCYSWLIFG